MARAEGCEGRQDSQLAELASALSLGNGSDGEEPSTTFFPRAQRFLLQRAAKVRLLLDDWDWSAFTAGGHSVASRASRRARRQSQHKGVARKGSGGKGKGGAHAIRSKSAKRKQVAGRSKSRPRPEVCESEQMVEAGAQSPRHYNSVELTDRWQVSSRDLSFEAEDDNELFNMVEKVPAGEQRTFETFEAILRASTESEKEIENITILGASSAIRSSIARGEMRVDPLTHNPVPNDIFVRSLNPDGSLPNLSGVTHQRSRYLGVTRQKRSGRWEAQIWIRGHGRQVYLGAYDSEEHAAEAYDLAMLKLRGVEVAMERLNHPLTNYEHLLGMLDQMTLDEVLSTVKMRVHNGH